MCIQALVFYFPYWLWKMFGLGEVKRWVLISKSTSTEEQKQAKIQDLILEVYKKSNRRFLFGIYVACELVNFGHVIVEIIFVIWFLGAYIANYVTEFFGQMEHTINVSYSYVKIVYDSLKCLLNS